MLVESIGVMLCLHLPLLSVFSLWSCKGVTVGTLWSCKRATTSPLWSCKGVMQPQQVLSCAALGPTSCHGWVVSRMMPLKLHWLLVLAWTVLSVSRQCGSTGMTRSGCCVMVFLLSFYWGSWGFSVVFYWP